MSKQVEKGPPTDEGKEGLKLKKKVGRPKKLNKSTETVKLDLSKKRRRCRSRARNNEKLCYSLMRRKKNKSWNCKKWEKHTKNKNLPKKV